MTQKPSMRKSIKGLREFADLAAVDIVHMKEELERIRDEIGALQTFTGGVRARAPYPGSRLADLYAELESTEESHRRRVLTWEILKMQRMV